LRTRFSSHLHQVEIRVAETHRLYTTPPCCMPLQHTFSCRDFNDENQPVTITGPPSLSPLAPDPPITHLRRQMQPLHGSALFNSLASSSPTTNRPSDLHNLSTTIPYQRSLQYYKDQRQIVKFQQNEGAATVLHSPEQPSGPCMVGPPIIKLPACSFITASRFIIDLPVGTTSALRRSSPLGPHQHSLPGRPVFPPSAHEPHLYRQALRKSAHQHSLPLSVRKLELCRQALRKAARETKICIRRTGKKSSGVKKVG
jgi:hypothetical protein